MINFDKDMSNAIEGLDCKDPLDILRMLGGCALGINGENDADVAASVADKAAFENVIDYKVGKGEMPVELGAEVLVDRAVAEVAPFIHKFISEAVDKGCRAAGGFIGGLFGPEAAVIGERIGGQIASVLNKDLSPYIDKGIDMVKDFAKSTLKKLKEGADSVMESISSMVSDGWNTIISWI